MHRFALLIIFTLIGSSAVAAQEVVFKDDFQGDLSAWATIGYGVLLPDSLAPGNQVLAFSQTADGGNIWSTAIAMDDTAQYHFSFRYRGATNGVDSGGYLGFFDPQHGYFAPGLIWGTQPDNSAVELIDDGQWHTYELTFRVSDYFGQLGGALQIVVEDWDGVNGGNPPPNVPLDAFFDDIQLTRRTANPSNLAFTNVFDSAGFTDWTYVNQPSVIDFNGDGWDDLFLARRDGMLPRLFLNNQHGGFTEDNAALGALQNLLLTYAVFGDIDNDGHEDVVVIMEDSSLRVFYGSSAGFVENTSPAFAGATFQEVGLWDSDNDGDLDILGNGLGEVGPLTFYVNDSGTFLPTVLASEVAFASVADLDSDGLADIVATHSRPANTPWASHTVLRNNGNNTFTSISNTGLPPLPHFAPCTFDYNNDGRLDIYNGTMDWGNPSHPWLFRNDGSWTFTDATTPSLSVGNHYYVAAIAGDADRDGDLDFYNTLGPWTTGLFFENLDGADFREASATYGINVSGGNNTKTGIWLDYDHDNDLDLFVTNTWNANGGWLFRNDIATGNWLKVTPQASISNKSLHGTRVVAYWGGKSQIQHYERNLTPYPDSYSATKFFGLGNAATVDSVVVYWASGSVSTERNVPANSALVIQEMAAPRVLSVLDVPDDQGGQLAVTFTALSSGNPDGAGQFSGYEIQRRSGGAWALVTTIAATAVDPYVVAIGTTDIFTMGQPAPVSEYRIVAHTSDPGKSSYSNVASAYSIDNLAPPKPNGFLIEAPDWRVVACSDPQIPDLAQACFYRGNATGFAPDEALSCSPAMLAYHETQMNNYFYRIQFKDTHGNLSAFSDELPSQFPAGADGVLPAKFALEQNQPNPFNPSTTIKFSLADSAPVHLGIYDVAGKLVRNLIAGQVMGSGQQEKVWDGRDEVGRSAPAGIYFYQLTAGEFVEVRRMALVK